MAENTQKPSDFIGTTGDDTIASGFTNAEGQTLDEQLDAVDKVNGHAGDDTIRTGEGSDLAAGDMVGQEWSFVDGKWVYNPDLQVNSGLGATRSYNDNIQTGAGDDVLLGNGGDDTLSSGRGNDLINAGTGNDMAHGGAGDDVINLEDGNDTAFGGIGDDTVNAGDGDDLVHGDDGTRNNMLADSGTVSSLSQHAASGAWQIEDIDGQSVISQSVGTTAGEDYTIQFELATNLAAGYSTGKIEVLWNGEVVDTVSTESGVFNTYEVTVTSTGDEGSLSFRALQPDQDTSIYDFSGPIVSYDKEISFGGDAISVDAFAPGQAALYQVIDGHLKVFDVEAKEYMDVGDPPGFKINAVGFNVEDDLIYGVAKSNGVDSLGTPVSSTDIVMIDAAGATYRVGKGFYGDYVGDFDDSGNLWTFHTTLDRISVADVDNLDANGDPQISHYHLPKGLFTDRTYDLAYNAEEDSFYAVVSPGRNGEAGKVVRIDVSDVQTGGQPTFQEVPITGTLYGDTMQSGMAKGAYGAVFMDGDGNLYYGLNRGDHDLDASTGSQGAIFKVNVDWEAGQAYSEFMSEAQSTMSNDGTVDPRSADAFAEVDAEAAVLMRNPEVTLESGGNDVLRGGDGQDTLVGNAGGDTIQGGDGQDDLRGETGNDRMFGGTGNDMIDGGSGNDFADGGLGQDTIQMGTGDDTAFGGDGDDSLTMDAGHDEAYGGLGYDTLSGGAGDDTLFGNDGDDQISGGTGADRMYGGAGQDTLSGGEDADKLYGGGGGDTLLGDAGDDTLVGNDGADNLAGGAGKDLLLGGSDADRLDGGADADKLVGGSGSDTLTGGAGNDHMWGGNWSGDNAADTFVFAAGSGKDIIHDFEATHDQIDLRSYGLDYDRLQDVMTDHGWAVEIDLSSLNGGQSGDRVFLKSVDPDDLDESNFLL
ncbi:calcium-binding protein [Cognatishimia sp.]|uniref:calcium-binding protein n=1 Tax=Cognatishimia sp. TaxID=2211648 RepID=UPI003512246E